MSQNNLTNLADKFNGRTPGELNSNSLLNSIQSHQRKIFPLDMTNYIEFDYLSILKLTTVAHRGLDCS